MEDLILKVAYPYRDERLFPAGWRSFELEQWINFNIEYTREISLVLSLEGPVDTEISLVNDLSGTIVNYVIINQFEISSEIIFLNNINTEQTTEFSIVNDLLGTIKDYSLINTLEISSEIIFLNNINTEQTREISIVNDLLGTTNNYILINQLEISEEILFLNNINTEQTREYIIHNYLVAEKLNEIIVINDIYENEIAESEIIVINSLRESVNLDTYSHSVSVFLDNSPITEYIKSWTINISEDSYVHSMTINFIDYRLFSSCSPATLIKTRRIKFVIDSIEFQFLLEKRDVSRQSDSGEFSIWGRSLIAVLDLPYATPIIDKDVVYDSETDSWYCPDDSDYTPHIWQTKDCLASEIIDAVIKPPFATTSFSLDFLINDYIVKHGALSVSNSSPIQVVNQLASAVGGRVRTDLLDKVVVKYYKFNVTGSEKVTYVDTENILQLNENISFPEGYNKVLVQGWEDPLEEKSVGLKIELDSTLNEEKSTFYFSEDIWFRVYYSPFSVTYSIECSLGSVYQMSSGTVTTITDEKAVFIGSEMQLEYPINTITSIRRYDCSYIPSSQYSYTQGYDFVTVDSSIIQDEPVVITYTTKSDLYKLIVNQPCEPLPWSEVISRITIRQT